MAAKNLYFLLLCWVFLFMGCDQKAGNVSGREDTVKAASHSENGTGNPISGIRLTGLDGEVISLKKYAGKTVFLNFWATWCKPCLKEMPSIERARKQLAGNGFVFLAASDEDPEKIKKFKDSHNYGFQWVHLKSKFPDVGIYSLPTTLIINKEGALAMKKAGALEWDSPEMIKQLEEIADNQ